MTLQKQNYVQHFLKLASEHNLVRLNLIKIVLFKYKDDFSKKQNQRFF